MLIIFEGPEAAGKSTIIADMFPTAKVVNWGPVESIDVYFEPAIEAVKSDDLIVWNRGWPSEHIYNELLNRGRETTEKIKQLEAIEGVRKICVFAEPEELQRRRDERVARGETDDLPVDPEQEFIAYYQYATKYGWMIVLTEAETNGETLPVGGSS